MIKVDGICKSFGKVRAVREPTCIRTTPDGRTLVVANLLPDGVGTDPTMSAEVSIIDAAALKQTATVKLPPGSTSVNGVCTSPDGKWAYIVHGLGPKAGGEQGGRKKVEG